VTEKRVQLTTTASVVLDGSGNGRVSIGPSVVRERWAPNQATVSASTTVLEATCALYLGVGGVPGRLLGASRTGSSGDVYGFGAFELQAGQSIVAVWSGGDVGATATINVFGEKVRGSE
jgi:hypothetical protein